MLKDNKRNEYSLIRDHNNISFRKNPFVWLRDKRDTVLNQRKVYTLAAIPSAIVAFGLIADLLGVLATDKTVLVVLLIICLFIYGIINLYLITAAQRSVVRIDKQKSVAMVMHRIVAHNIRDYLTYKKNRVDDGLSLSSGEIKGHISRLLQDFCSFYLTVYYREAVTITLKYKKNDVLYSIIEGKRGVDGMDPPSESIEQSWVYKALRMDGKIKSYIYVKNLAKIDGKEKRMLSPYTEEIINRAKDRYATFIALPIRWGSCKVIVPSSKFKPKPELGLIGIDLMEPFGFGNLEENEIHILLCLADLISEHVNDLIETE